MYLFVYLSLIFLISCEIFSISCGRPKRPREYVEEYPDVRKIDITPRPLPKKNSTLDSRVGNHSKRKDAIEHPHSKVANINPKPDVIGFGIGIDFIETTPTNVAKKSNTTRHNHNRNTKKKVKRVIRQSDEWEPKDCANCLDEKYMKHYYAKGCKPIFEITCKKPCPKYFVCPKKQTKPPIQGCEYKGIVYNASESIPNSNECLHCMCTDMPKPKINCAVSECFGDWKPQKPNCYRFYEEGKCCSRTECLTDEQFANVKTCSYDGKNYKYGEKIYPKEDSCLSCICGEKWNQSDPLNSEGCKRIECNFELESKWKDREGCVPIYHPKTCCPVDYHCPLPKEWKCLFDGKQYEIGEKLDTKNDCIDCECRVPPDFTCMRKICDSLPVGANCEPIYESNKCCPTYNCTIDQIETTDEKSKRFLNDETPALGKLEPDPCPPFLPGGLYCAGTNCTTILDKNGCQACSCEIPCPELDCNYPCNLFAVTPGECPKCSCP